MWCCLQLNGFLSLFPAEIWEERFKDHFRSIMFLSFSVQVGCIFTNIIFWKTLCVSVINILVKGYTQKSLWDKPVDLRNGSRTIFLNFLETLLLNWEYLQGTYLNFLEGFFFWLNSLLRYYLRASWGPNKGLYCHTLSSTFYMFLLQGPGINHCVEGTCGL